MGWGRASSNKNLKKISTKGPVYSYKENTYETTKLSSYANIAESVPNLVSSFLV